MSKEWLLGKTLAELELVVKDLGMPLFTAKQIAQWLYKHRVVSVGQMTNLSAKNRQLLDLEYEVGCIPFSKVSESSDGTKKYLFETRSGNFIETAYIPDSDRATLCVSSQAGCRMGCRFCMTAKQGFGHDLSTGEIINQINAVTESDRLTNIVYMGMGEPLDNTENVLRSLEILTSDWGYGWSPTRITLSTIGVIPAMREFLNRSKVHLAVSLHNPIALQRLAMMPVENKYPVEQVIEELRRHDFTHQRRVSFEYIMFKGQNDSMQHVAALSRLLAGMKCRINLIRFHEIEDSEFVGSDTQTMVRFRDALTKKGFITTIRSSRGEDIQAACGLLSTKQAQHLSNNSVSELK